LVRGTSDRRTPVPLDDAIRVDGLRKHYGDVAAVDGITFRVAEGQIFGLLGPNGSGKTTTVE
jgi:ABC-2 type transport system ATP-binding protein